MTSKKLSENVIETDNDVSVDDALAEAGVDMSNTRARVVTGQDIAELLKDWADRFDTPGDVLVHVEAGLVAYRDVLLNQNPDFGEQLAAASEVAVTIGHAMGAELNIRVKGRMS